ncbi:unnamed protein product [Mytilus edulis]|uniref:NudC domain-containing protein 1 n=1 Tax=Mytilus edulis TaxID=6550 RepID=A0A8S3RWM9_MYTED|nr:unnamed protein product [Mytilus edulis]
MAEKFDLQIKRELLDSSFDGYKLSLDSLPTYSLQLGIGIEKVDLTDGQYSYHHAKILGQHNHLALDPWNQQTVYYIDQLWRINKAFIADMQLNQTESILQIPDSTNQKLVPERVNLCLQFVSMEMAVVTDGAGKLHLINTGNRGESSTKWTIVYSHDVLDDSKPFSLTYTVYHREGETHSVECLCSYVVETNEEQKEKYKTSFLTVLEWISISSEDNKAWSLKRHRRLYGRKPFDYAAFDQSGDCLIVAAESDVEFVYDSIKPVVVTENVNVNASNTAPESCPEYTWNQNAEDVNIQFTVPEGTKKSDIYMTLTHNKVNFGIKNGKVLLEGMLHGFVDVDGSTWIMEKQMIELTLSKQSGESWQAVVIGDNRGEMTLDPAVVEEIHQRLAGLTSYEMNPDPEKTDNQPFNAQQLEECDAFPDDGFGLLRIDGNSHKITHKTNLGSHQWLFQSRLEIDQPPALCLRHDVDGLMIQPQNTVKESETPWHHTATFNAFGYVQASKQQRRFSICAPDSSYVAICDCVRHIYIYRQPTAILSPLRNRKTGQEVGAVAKQQLVSLDAVNNIIGIQVTNDYIFVTTENKLYCITVKSAVV